MVEGELCVAIPTMRPKRIRRLVDNLVARTPIFPKIVIISHLPEVFEQTADQNVTTWDDGPEVHSFGHRINAMFERTTEPYFFMGADDVWFQPRWYEVARSYMDSIPGGGVVAVNDLWNGSGTLALIARSYIEECDGTMDGTGPVIHRGFAHSFSETELFDTAKARGRFAYARESIVEHVHPYAGKSEWDDVYTLGYSTSAQDEALFKSRQHLWLSPAQSVG